jgi:uncharacterized membrane protein YsdA (DUF1294 family)
MVLVSVILAIWNIIVFSVYGIDKLKSKGRVRRISERSLLLAAALMGGLGALLGMLLFRHKTKRAKFKVGVPLLLVLNAVVIIVVAMNR